MKHPALDFNKSHVTLFNKALIKSHYHYVDDIILSLLISRGAGTERGGVRGPGDAGDNSDRALQK